MEKAAGDVERAGAERELCRAGVTDLDQATVCTLHSFAAQLLHERPLEAGLPPGFDTSDEIVAGLKFDEAWNEWLDDVLEADSALYDHLALALTLGVTLAQLEGVGAGVSRQLRGLGRCDLSPPTEPPEGTAATALRERWPEAERLCQFSKNRGPGTPCLTTYKGVA